MQPNKNNLEWNVDGHTVSMRLSGPELDFKFNSCPVKGAPDTSCHVDGSGCVVQWFVDRFGIECNVGTSAVEEVMEIAWAFTGQVTDLDSAQVWIISRKDDAFAGFFDTVSGGNDGVQ